MSSTQQVATSSSDPDHGKKNKAEKRSKRFLSTKEEEVLLASVKELVAQGWKSDNGFRAGYLNKLEDAMKKEFPGTDLTAMPHLNSKLCAWKKNYYSLCAMLSRSGVGFNAAGNHMIDCNDDQWEQIVKCDANARTMRRKSWPLFEDWKLIFGKDKATGDNVEDVMDAVNELMQEENLATKDIDGDYHVNLEEIYENDAAEDSVCQSQKGEACTKKVGRKRKVTDPVEGVYELLGEFNRNTNERLDNIVSRIGYEFDLAKAKKEAFELLGTIPDLSLEQKFDVCEILADNPTRLEIFMGLPEYARPSYVLRLLASKPH